MSSKHPKIASLETIESLRSRLDELELNIPTEDDILTRPQSPLAQSDLLGNLKVGNRWCIHPMEGWDANPDGSPSAHTLRRWRNFGLSGAKLIWGGEAAAVQPAGRANLRQTLATPTNRIGLQQLRERLVAAHRDEYGNTDDLVVGLQLTHSGRFSRPKSEKIEPRIAYHHPLLDEKVGIDTDNQSVVCTDDELELLVDDFVVAAGLAHDTGYQFVDIKACHGYLLHECLSARRRPGRFGGDFDGRTRLLRTIIRQISETYPDLCVAVRLSVFDTQPYQPSPDMGQPVRWDDEVYDDCFSHSPELPTPESLAESIRLIRCLQALDVMAVNITCGSPYYNPHIQRPAMFPPSDGYLPPEDPLVGVARQIHAARICKQAVPTMPMVGSGYSYLQDYLPHVAQAVVRAGWIDFVGLGRMVLSYPNLPEDILSDGQMARKQVCRTFSDCTTGPRNGIISGCFPLDKYYKDMPEAQQLKEIKRRM